MSIVLSEIFGACMGSIIGHLYIEKDYAHAVLAVVAFVIYLLKIAGV
jgi:hypothetical protein